MYFIKRIKQYLIVLLFINLTACGSYLKQNDTALPDDGFSQQIKPQQNTSSAVLALIKKARANAIAGDIDTAMIRLERAVRIEPSNSTVWHYMAKLFLQKENYKQAAGYAAKSINLAANNKPLIIDNWRIIAHARYRLGNTKGAHSAQEKINKLQQ